MRTHFLSFAASLHGQRLFLLLPLFALTLSAQPRSVHTPDVAAREARESGWRTKLELSHAYSPESDLERTAHVGDIAIQHVGLEVSASRRVTDQTSLMLGLSGKYHALDVSGAAPLPDELHAVGLSVGASRKLETWFGPGWSGAARLQTEFSSDSIGLDGAKASYAGALSASYRQSPTLSWTFGVLARTSADLPVLPLLAARWNFAPKWVAAFGAPSTSVSYEYSPRVTLHTAISFNGGLYHVTTAPAAGLGDTWLEYNEVRAGVGGAFQASQRLKVTVGAGLVVHREFDYFDRDYSIDGDTAPYIAVGLEARF